MLGRPSESYWKSVTNRFESSPTTAGPTLVRSSIGGKAEVFCLLGVRLAGVSPTDYISVSELDLEQLQRPRLRYRGPRRHLK